MASAIATKRLGTQQQVDTYFHCHHGRLKLRQIDGLQRRAGVVRPARQWRPQAKRLSGRALGNPETLKAALPLALGVRAVVEKRREMFLYHNVRIHLDEVTGLGQFLEFEAVLGPNVDEAAGRALIDSLTAQFGILPADLLPNSYGEMILLA